VCATDRAILIFALTMIAVLGFVVEVQFDDVQQSIAQNTTSGKVSFENSSFGFQIDYPDDWQIVNEYKRIPTFENL
jgi:hypothetical protein